jgi:hypothetical protein
MKKPVAPGTAPDSSEKKRPKKPRLLDWATFAFSGDARGNWTTTNVAGNLMGIDGYKLAVLSHRSGVFRWPNWCQLRPVESWDSEGKWFQLGNLREVGKLGQWVLQFVLLILSSVERCCGIESIGLELESLHFEQANFL